MVDQDLETLYGETPKFIINGKEHSLKDLDVETHLLCEYKAQRIDEEIKIVPSDEKAVKKLAKSIREYIGQIFEISPAEASKVRFNDYKRVRTWQGRRDLYDQGFNDEEINRLEKESTNKAFFRALNEATSDV